MRCSKEGKTLIPVKIDMFKDNKRKMSNLLKIMLAEKGKKLSEELVISDFIQ